MGQYRIKGTFAVSAIKLQKYTIFYGAKNFQLLFSMTLTNYCYNTYKCVLVTESIRKLSCFEMVRGTKNALYQAKICFLKVRKMTLFVP